MKAVAGRFQAGKTILVSAILVILIALSGLVDRTDLWWFDSLQAIGASRAPVPQETALVLIDEQSLTALGNPPFAMRWPWPRAAFAALLAGLEAAGAERIVVDLVFFESSAAAEQDLLLGAVAAGLPGVVLATVPGRHPAVWPPEFRNDNAESFRWQDEVGVRTLTGRCRLCHPPLRSARFAGSSSAVCPGAAEQFARHAGTVALAWQPGTTARSWSPDAFRGAVRRGGLGNPRSRHAGSA